MTPADLRTARHRLNLSQHGMAEALGMGRWGWQSVSKWERGVHPIPGPIALLVGVLLDAGTKAEVATGLETKPLNR